MLCRYNYSSKNKSLPNAGMQVHTRSGRTLCIIVRSPHRWLGAPHRDASVGAVTAHPAIIATTNTDKYARGAQCLV